MWLATETPDSEERKDCHDFDRPWQIKKYDDDVKGRAIMLIP